MTDDPEECPRDLGLFRDLDTALRGELRQHGSLQRGKPRQVLYREGDSAQAVWILAEGRVRTCKLQPSGRITTLEEFEAGDPIGLGAVLQSPLREETAEWLCAGKAWCIPASLLAHWMHRDTRLAIAVLSIVASRLRRAHDRLCSFSAGRVAARIAQALLEKGCQGRIQVTRQALSEVAGTTVETTIRTLGEFQRSRWIESGKGWIRIRDGAALRRLAQGLEPVPDGTRGTDQGQ